MFLIAASIAFLVPTKVSADFESDAGGCMVAHTYDVHVCYLLRNMCTATPQMCDQYLANCMTYSNNSLYTCGQSAVNNVPTPSPEYCAQEIQAYNVCGYQASFVYGDCIAAGGDSETCSQATVEAFIACNALDSGRCR